MYAPGHLGELAQIVDFVLVDTVIEETGSREERLRLLRSRVVVHFGGARGGHLPDGDLGACCSGAPGNGLQRFVQLLRQQRPDGSAPTCRRNR